MITIDWATKVIFVPKSFSTLVQISPSEIRSLDLNAFRVALKDIEDNEDGIVYPDTHRHNTEVTLSGINYARVIEILSPYTVTFEDGQYAVNLIGANSNVADRVNVNQVSVRAANSAGLVNIAEIANSTQATKRLVEGLRADHKGYGKMIFWNPDIGVDTNDGLSPTSGVRTFARAHDIASDWGHDIIVVVPTIGSRTEIHEPIVISKNFVFVRGMGYNSHIHPTATTAGGRLLEITGNGVELSGFHVDGVNIATPNTDGIYVTGGHVLIKDCTVEDCTGNGIVINTTALDDQTLIDGCLVRLNVKDGIRVDAGAYTRLRDCTTEDNGESGIRLTGAGFTEDIDLENCHMLRNTGYGLRLDAGAIDTSIQTDCEFENNIAGNFLDNGAGTVWHEQLARSADAAAVWQNATGAQMAIRLAEAWGRLGLDPSKPLNTGQTSITFGQIVMALTGDAANTTVTRAP
jgi:hypothetical protein